ncbi:MAG: MmgE/PrpD family protein [Flavisolibacter sp.]
MSEKTPQTYQIANFALSRTYKDLPAATIDQLKKHLLDSTASVLHCLHRPTIEKLTNQMRELSEGGKCNVPILGRTSFDRAAQLYTALIRYPDFMDNFLGKEATCHPCDNIGALLAASQMVDASGEEFLLSMAIAYEIECRLIKEIPVMIKGFDHTLLFAYSITAGLCRLLKLSVDETANALAIAGCSFNPLVACRASYTKEWKGLMSSMVAFGCMNIVLQAKQGITGPTQIFEGNKGFSREIGMDLDYNWDDDHFDLIPKCILKSYNSEVHTQSLIETALELKQKHNIDPAEIEHIELITFLTAYHIVGGGEYGDRHTVFSKEQGDHSLPYTIAAALLDNELYPDAFLVERINRADVQQLLKKVHVKTKFPLHNPKQVAGLLDPYTKAYPDKMMAEVKIKMNNGEEYSLEKDDYHGFHTRPLSWTDVKTKFRRLSAENAQRELQNQVIDVISNLEQHQLKDLTELIASAGKKNGSVGQFKQAG